MHTQLYFKFLLTVSLLLSFSFGAVVGYFVPHGPFKHGGPGKMKKVMLAKMSRELDLTSVQKEQVRKIFESIQPKMKALHEESRPKFDAIRDEARAEIRKILTPDQLPKFEALNAKMDERMKKRFDKRF